jgi:endoglucanase
LVLDCTPANDLPDWNGEENTRYNSRLDYGPAFYIADRATLSDPRLLRHFVATAKDMNIPYQIRQPGGGGTDAGAIHQQKSGIPSLSISVPGRYLHTAASLVRISDWQNTLYLVRAGLANLEPKMLKIDRP